MGCFTITQDHPRLTCVGYIEIYRETISFWPLITVLFVFGYLFLAFGVALLGFFPHAEARLVAFRGMGIGIGVIAISFLIRWLLCVPVEYRVLGT